MCDLNFVLQYYKRLFPYPQYAKWLQYGNIDKTYMARRYSSKVTLDNVRIVADFPPGWLPLPCPPPPRELSFTLADDIYIRYLSFSGAEDLEAEMIKR